MKVNAVFEGGGVRGIALVGAVKAAENYGVQFNKLAGTSSGALIASLIAAGYSADEMRSIIEETPFETFLKRSAWFYLPFLGKGVRILTKKGLYPGDLLEQWIREKLAAKGVRTFADLEPGKLRIIASDISSGKLLVLPDDIKQYGVRPEYFEVARAVRMSTSIPFFFDPVVLRTRGGAPGERTWKTYPYYICDGAVLSNFPLWLFDKESEWRGERSIPTIGFQLVGKQRLGPRTIRGPFTMLQALFSTMMDAHDERYIEKQNRFRTIKVPSMDVSVTDFSLSEQKSRDLYESGLDAGTKYFKAWSYAEYAKHYQNMITKPGL